MHPLPAYRLEIFLCACSEGIGKVFISKGAMETAKSDFNFTTQAGILDFIAADGLESPHFINNKIWENNLDPSIKIMVDSYGFFVGMSYGYIAFLYQPKTSKWIIKSLKRNRDPDPRNLPLRGLGRLINQQKWNSETS